MRLRPRCREWWPLTDEKGIAIGEIECPHWQSVDRVEERTCCGGRISYFAYVKCAKKGVVSVILDCRSTCLRNELLAVGPGIGWTGVSRIYPGQKASIASPWKFFVPTQTAKV